MRLLTTQEKLREMASLLDQAARFGPVAQLTPTVRDEPEGTVVIHVSHTLAMAWSQLLCRVAEELEKEDGVS